MVLEGMEGAVSLKGHYDGTAVLQDLGSQNRFLGLIHLRIKIVNRGLKCFWLHSFFETSEQFQLVS